MMIMAFLPPVPPLENEPARKPDATTTVIMLVIIAILFVPFGWLHQTRSKWPPRKLGWTSSPLPPGGSGLVG